MASNKLFFYFGDDEAYFKALQGEFQNNTKMAIDFKRVYETVESRIQSLFIKVYKEKPACVFIDFSKQTQDYLHLARLFTRTPLDHQLMIVGLVDYLSPPEVLQESIATGLNLIFIKSPETFDVVFATTKILSPSDIGEHGFATAALKENWEAGEIAKVGYVTEKGLHIETNQKISKGDRIRMKHSWTNKRVVPSKEFFISNVSTSNMFYQFKMNADADFVFVDEFVPPEGMDPAQIKERTAERVDLIEYHQKQLKRWIKENQTKSQEKKAKVLVVDRGFHFYQSQARADKHPYSVRCIPYFADMQQELDRLQPQVIIAIELEKPEVENARNNPAMLKELVGMIKGKFAELKPFIIVFNGEKSSAELQAEYQYPLMIAYGSELSVEAMVKLADVYEKKVADTKNMSMADSGLEKVFLKKTNTASLAEILNTVTIVKLSESDMVFQSTFPFTEGTNLHFDQPIKMMVSLKPAKAQGKLPEFYGLIHCLGEVEKKELRHYVNAIFFRDLDAGKEAELVEFSKLNKAKQLERANQLKAEAEAKAKAEADAKATKEAEEASKEAAKNAAATPATEEEK